MVWGWIRVEVKVRFRLRKSVEPVPSGVIPKLRHELLKVPIRLGLVLGLGLEEVFVFDSQS